MTQDGIQTLRDTAIDVRPHAGGPSYVTVSGRIELADEDVGPFTLQAHGLGKTLQVDCTEANLNSRAVRRGKTDPRRVLRIEPLNLDLARGPVQLVLQSAAPPRVVAQIDLPGAAIARFRRLLGLELANGITQHRTARRSLRLEVIFDTLPEAPDDPLWLESYVLLNCIRRTRPARTHAMIGQLRDHRAAEAKPHLYADFMALLTATPDLMVPNGHGFGPSLNQLDRTQLWQGISDIMELLRGMGLTVFLNSGTLLGAVREGDLLGHDDDIDLAVLVAGRSQQDAAQSWLDLCARLEAKGIRAESSGRSAAILKLPRIHGVQVDLFPAWIDGSGNLFIYPHTHGTLKRADLLPLKPGPHAGTRIPARAPRILEQNYGPGWRVPDPLFRFPWNEAKSHFYPFLTHLRATLDPATDESAE